MYAINGAPQNSNIYIAHRCLALSDSDAADTAIQCRPRVINLEETQSRMGTSYLV